MTTIAYKEGVLASDSQSTLGDVIYENDCQKIFENVGPFEAIAVAGSYQDAVDVLKVISAYTDIDQIRNIDFKQADIKANFLAVTHERELWYYAGDKSWQMRPDIPFSIGSGGDFAWGAMLHGATAIEAVKIASQLDVGTNAVVQYIDLNTEA